MTPIALTIAGSDSGGGAGIQADIKTFSAMKVYGASVITALTAQNTVGVQGIYNIPPSFVKQQIESVLVDIKVSAIKIGMLSTCETIEVVAQSLENFPNPIVLDPVMVAASGDLLLDLEAIDILKKKLLPRADIITPNLIEAARLLNTSIAKSEKEMEEQGLALVSIGAKAVLIKGGHSEGGEAVDFLITPRKTLRFATPRINISNVHGTGCTLASAIAAELAKGETIEEAVKIAKNYIFAAIYNSSKLNIGNGCKPAHHFYAFW